MAAGRSQKIRFIWLSWLLGCGLCFAVLYYPHFRLNGAAEKDKSHPASPSGSPGLAAGDFQVNPSGPEAAPHPYALQGLQGLLSLPDINASVPTLNNRGQVVVEAQDQSDLLRAFTAPSPGQPSEVPRITAPLKISPDPEAVKQKIAAKHKELCDDVAFKAELGKLEAEMKNKHFSERANQMTDKGVGSLIKKYAKIHGVDARLVWAVIRHESGFNPQAVSPKGAMGLMQLIPSTAALMGVSDPFDVEQNISGGVRFLKICLTKFNNNVIYALAAYNAGPDNVTKYQGCPPFAETRNYVLKVMRDYTGKTIALPLPVLAAAKARPNEKNQGEKSADPAAAAAAAGLDWKVPQAKFKVAGPTWKLPLGPTIVAGKIPDAIRQNPEVIRLIAKHNARKLLP